MTVTAAARFQLCGLVVVLVCLAGHPAQAADPPLENARDLLTERQRSVVRDSPAWQALLDDGKARTDFCARCHGEDGNSKSPLVPNLAGQNPYYLLDQIERFADGRRKDFIMSPLARQYSRQGRVAVSLYYANMPARSQKADPVQIARGATLYHQHCVACHGEIAHGSDQNARLAGQNPAYLKQRLTAFRQLSGPASSPMTDIARGLNENEIDQLSAYLSSLP